MEEEEKIDEIAANVLLLDGLDFPTAVAGSLNESPSATKVSKSASKIGAIVALIITLLFLYIWTHL
jgi:hypothetical protein